MPPRCRTLTSPGEQLLQLGARCTADDVIVWAAGLQLARRPCEGLVHLLHRLKGGHEGVEATDTWADDACRATQESTAVG